MMFQPSPYSYGQVEDPALDPAAPPEKKPLDPSQIGAYVDLGIGALRGLFGMGDEYMTVAQLQGQIEVARKKRDNNAFPGAWHWDDRIIILSQKIPAAEARQSEEQTREALWIAGYGGVALAALAGAVLVGGLAINQIQKARLQQAEIMRLRGK